ncbi:MAG: alanine dehydrogenase [Planctomycetota bacterium]
MIIGVPKEIKAQEGRIGMVPAGVAQLVEDGHQVLIEGGGGLGAGIPDEAYAKVGGTIVDGAEAVWSRADMIVKVKEPLPEEWARIRKDQTLFTYFHFAASRELTDAMLASGAYCFAYETLVDPREEGLPLLTPMSEVAGRMSIQVGAYHLERPRGGNGTLLGGVPGVEPGKVVILGGGVVGTEAARMAAGLGARVYVLDISLERLRELSLLLPPNVFCLHSSRYNILEHIRDADLIVGAVLVRGHRAPMLVRREDLATVPDGSVIVDVAIDQGGCIETCRPTTHDHPTFVVDGVVHYCVANMPGGVPQTSTYALTAATTPYVRKLARLGPVEAIRGDGAFQSAASIVKGTLCDEAVADSFGMEFVAAESAV